MTNRQEKLRVLVSGMFRDGLGGPMELTEGQLQLFEAIYYGDYPWWHVMTTTQYGKSLDAGLAVLLACCTKPMKVAIIAGKKDKAQIIMDYVISHIFDNEYTRACFSVSEGESEEYIRRYRNKSRLTFKLPNGLMSEVFIGSAKDALGFGAPNVIIDEAAFVTDTELALVMRMLGAAGKAKTFLMKIGNPFKRNHFLKSFRDPMFRKIVIDYEQAIKEGRLTKEFIEVMRKQAFFDILYGVKFPAADAIDSKGYSPLLSEADLDRAYLEDLPMVGDRRLGIDVAAGGRNYSVIVLRAENAARVLWRADTKDTMIVVTKALELAAEHKVPKDALHLFPDAVGDGKGASDRLAELTGEPIGVNVGNRPEEHPDSNDFEDKFNLRAQAYWRLKNWVQSGGKLLGQGTFDELLDIRYKIQSDRKIQIKPKKEMLEDDGIESPDVADALMLTFARTKETAYSRQATDSIRENREERQTNAQDAGL